MATEETIRLILLNKYEYEVQDYISYCNACVDMDLTAVTNSASEGLRMVRDYLPDAVILDLELEDGNGLEFLNGLYQMKLPYPPYIIVVTSLKDARTLQNAREHGAGFIVQKSQPGYHSNGPKIVSDFLRNMKPYFNYTETPDERGPKELVPPADRDEQLRHAISETLGRIGIAAGNASHIYLVEAILVSSQQSDGIVEMENVIYPTLAKKFKTTRSALERSMRQRVETTWATTDVETLERNYTQYVDPRKGKPALKDFIAYYATKFRR